MLKTILNILIIEKKKVGQSIVLHFHPIIYLFQPTIFNFSKKQLNMR
jgi:hypothetical protein